MGRIGLLPAVATIALLGACEARIGNDAPSVADNATAEGRAEQGRLTIEAPGFNLQLDIPESVMTRADMDGDSALIYPGSSFGGIHVQGNRAGTDEDQVELRFSTGDEIGRVAAWYRDPARGSSFAIASDSAEGAGFVISGTGRREDERFTLRIAPRAGGGTEARLLLSDAN